MSCLQQLARGGFLPPHEGVLVVEQLTTFCTLFSLYLSTLHDAEFYCEMKGDQQWLDDRPLRTDWSGCVFLSTGSSMPFSMPQLAAMIRVLRDVFVSLHMERPLKQSSSRPEPFEWRCLKKVALARWNIGVGLGRHFMLDVPEGGICPTDMFMQRCSASAVRPQTAVHIV